MTFSVVGFDPRSGDLGIAVASKFLAVGAVVPWARAGVGAVATQSWANTDFGPDGLSLMSQGMTAAQALDAVVEGDDGRDDRQAGFVDARGGAATFTGSRCLHWAGGVTGEGFAAQGNILAKEEVVAEMARAFVSAAGDLCDRLLAALLAGDAAGSDRRGRQSAALLVVRENGGYEGRNDRYIDIRVDDHPEAPRELARVFELWDQTILVRTDPALPATPELVSEVQTRLAALGHYEGEVSGKLDQPTEDALRRWAEGSALAERLRDDESFSWSLLFELRDVTPEVG